VDDAVCCTVTEEEVEGEKEALTRAVLMEAVALDSDEVSAAAVCEDAEVAAVEADGVAAVEVEAALAVAEAVGRLRKRLLLLGEADAAELVSRDVTAVAAGTEEGEEAAVPTVAAAEAEEGRAEAAVVRAEMLATLLPPLAWACKTTGSNKQQMQTTSQRWQAGRSHITGEKYSN
jgi:hypothetical protein